MKINPAGFLDYSMTPRDRKAAAADAVKFCSNVCVNAFEDNGDEGGKFAVLRTTGPLMWSFIVQDYEGDPNVRISTESTSPAKYTVFDTMNAHEGLTRTYYGDLKTSVFRKEMLPDKHQLEAEIQDM